MAFTLEDGTGLATSNAYISVAEFKSHHADRGVAAANDGTFTDSEVEGFIVQATDYLDKRFGLKFRGCKESRAQALQWPRDDAYDNADFLLPDIPSQLKKAAAEYALIVGQLGRNLAPIPPPNFGVTDPETGDVTNDSSGLITQKTEKVGPIEETTKYADGNSSGRPMVGSGNIVQDIPDYPQADLWLEELIDGYTSRDVYRA